MNLNNINLKLFAALSIFHPGTKQALVVSSDFATDSAI